MIWALAGIALGSDLHEGNVAATTVGVQHWQAPAQKEVGESSDTDILLGQRIRWNLSESDSLAVRLRADARFTLAPGDEVLFERSRVRQLGVSFVAKKLTIDVGRHMVHKGGPRLVDGLQALFHLSDRVQVGVWGGLLPDLFTTTPRIRPGGGPILAFASSRIQASVVGEFAVYDGVDRGAVLAMARFSASRTIEVSGRLDMELIGGPHLADAQVWTRWAPVPSTRVDVFYNAFSSYRYQNTENLAPDVRRFGERYIEDAGRLAPLLQDCLDPKVAHVVGSTFAFRPDGDKVAPTFRLAGRARFGPKDDLPPLDTPPEQALCQLDDINGFVRVNPAIGLARLPLGGSLDLTLDANYLVIDGRRQMDAGVMVFWEPTDDGVFSIDTSYRVVSNPYDAKDNPSGYPKLGTYADLFVDFVVVPADLTFGAGLNLETEPGIDLARDVGLGGYARLTKYLRPRKKG